MSHHLGDLGADKMLILRFIIPKWHWIMKLVHWWVILTQWGMLSFLTVGTFLTKWTIANCLRCCNMYLVTG